MKDVDGFDRNRRRSLSLESTIRPSDANSSMVRGGVFRMMDPDELRGLCAGFREDPKSHTDDVLIDRIVADVEGYRGFLADPRPQLPPEPLAGRLPLMGWLIYEASWEAVQR